MPFRVTETIHHGNYYNVQSSEGETILDALAEALRTSPYNFTAGLDNRYVQECYTELVTDGVGDFGWARYQLETEEP